MSLSLEAAAQQDVGVVAGIVLELADLLEADR